MWTTMGTAAGVAVGLFSVKEPIDRHLLIFANVDSH